MRNKRILLYFPLIVLLVCACSGKRTDKVDISGQWAFKIDSTDIGLTDNWFEKDLDDSTHLPGSMMENGKGNIPTLKTNWTGSIYDSSFYFNPAMEKYRQPGNIKFPFWLTPNLHYVGAAWYSRNIEIPENWTGKRIMLYLERPHWQTKVWVDNHLIGDKNSLATPHIYDLSEWAYPGQHRLTILIDNRLTPVNVGPDSHSVTDHTQGNWNGIVGEISILAEAPVYISDLQIYPDPEKKQVKASVRILKSSNEAVSGKLRIKVKPKSAGNETPPAITTKVDFTGDSKVVEVEVPMGDNFKYWDEFRPELYEMIAELNVNGQTSEKKSVFGMRTFEVVDDHFEINGRKVFLRGTLECNAFPLTGYPPTDEAGWEKVFQTCRESGLNHVRFHSHCPPDAAFRVADRLGIYLQVEGPSWPNHGTSLGNGRPVDQYLSDETARIIREYGNHPSFVMYAWGNEPRGAYVPFLDKQLRKWKELDNRRVYTAASIGMGWSVNPESQYLVRSGPRGLPFRSLPNSDFNYSGRVQYESRPYVTHEMGQWCVFPDFTEIDKYMGVYKAKNFELFKEDLEDKQMGNLAHDFLMASGKLQVLCYKAEIEAALRTPELDGFQLLGLSDFPGQGSAITGLLNVFWEEKGYVNKDEIKHFCNETVPLAILPKFVYTDDEILSAELEVAHFGSNDMEVTPAWKVTSGNGDIIKEGKLAEQIISTGTLTELGKLDMELASLNKTGKLKLTLYVGTFENSWDFWVYPSALPALDEDEVYYTNSLDTKAEKVLAEGGKVLLEAAGKVEKGKEVAAWFTPVFWNTSWFKMRPPHTLGILVQNNHPVFAEFATENHSNYQWWEILNGQQSMLIDSLPVGLQPLVQPIDTWFLNRRLAQLFEAKVGNGRLIVSSLNLSGEADKPASRQLKYSVLKYMNSEKFDPKDTVSISAIRNLFKSQGNRRINLYTKDAPDELKVKK